MHSDTREFIGFIGMCCSGIEAGFQQGVLQQDCSRIRLIFIGIIGMCCSRIGAGLQKGSLERDSSDVLFIYIACQNVLSMGRQGRHGVSGATIVFESVHWTRRRIARLRTRFFRESAPESGQLNAEVRVGPGDAIRSDQRQSWGRSCGSTVS